ncbi:MAG: hypothetical protein HC894_18700 [Microcoleus sp. SM1_3_4]|nr:hypothetical protein [Microcoleus sp. SM1_3_4]
MTVDILLVVIVVYINVGVKHSGDNICYKFQDLYPNASPWGGAIDDKIVNSSTITNY